MWLWWPWEECWEDERTGEECWGCDGHSFQSTVKLLEFLFEVGRKILYRYEDGGSGWLSRYSDGITVWRTFVVVDADTAAPRLR